MKKLVEKLVEKWGCFRDNYPAITFFIENVLIGLLILAVIIVIVGIGVLMAMGLFILFAKIIAFIISKKLLIGLLVGVLSVMVLFVIGCAFRVDL